MVMIVVMTCAATVLIWVCCAFCGWFFCLPVRCGFGDCGCAGWWF